MSELLSKKCSQTPVTALTIHEGLILSGQGPFIHVYDHLTSSLLASKQIFDSQCIHGIQVLNTTRSAFSTIVWGGRSLKAVSITKKSSEDGATDFCVSLDLQKTIGVEDWILDVASRPSSASSEGQGSVCAIFVTAHNALYSVKSYELSSSGLQSLTNISVETLLVGRKCILYSAHVKFISSNEVLTASGTAFGEIIVWSCSLDGSSPSIRTHFSFTGHEGSIFGVQISEKIDAPYKTPQRVLTSCSDDRTIRVWDISTVDRQVDAPSSSETLGTKESAQETGFPVNLTEERDSNCLAVAIGHVSRIWDIRYLYEREDHRKDHILTIISVGEDGTSQKWALCRESVLNSTIPTFNLSHLSTSAHHLGKNIWSVALSEDRPGSGTVVVATGGADGRIISRTLVSLKKDNESLEERDITTVLQTMFNLPASKPMNPEISRKASKATADYFRSYAYVKKNQFLVTTNNGLVLLEKLQTLEEGKPSRCWSQVGSLDDLKGYSVVSCIFDTGLAFLAGANGSLYCFDSSNNKITFLITTVGKVAGVFPYCLESSRPDDIAVLLTYLGACHPRLLRIQRSTPGAMAVSDDVFPNCGTDLGPPRSQNSSALVCCIQGETAIFLGYRDGKIVLLIKAKDGSVATKSATAHGEEAVTAMHWVANDQAGNSSDPRLGWLYSVGRDGTCAVHEVRGRSTQLLLVHKLALPFGPNIEGIYVTPSTRDVYVYGFHGKLFVAYNTSSSDYILSIDCGGAHRMWTFDPQYSSIGQMIGGTLAWTKASKLNSYGVLEPSHRVIQNGGHGREIKSCVISTNSTHLLGPLIATGAEDTDICLFQLKGWGLSCISTLKKHVTGIQSLQWSTNGSYLFSCGGYEEFFVWRVRSVPGVKAGVVFESSCPMDSERSDLRVMAFASKERLVITQPNDDKAENREFDIAMVYSNSVIKTWRYATETKLWTLLSTGRYTSACLNQVAYIDRGVETTLITAATDGHLAFWQVSQAIETISPQNLICLKTQDLHQSSIKSLSSCILKNNTSLLVTGGDDNGLGFTLVSSSDSRGIQCSALIIPRAHAAAVTATEILSCRRADTDPSCFYVHVATASNDQRIKIWEIDIDLRKNGVEGMKVKRGASGYTAVADVSSLALFPTEAGSEQAGTSILICGVGMEIWRLEAQ